MKLKATSVKENKDKTLFDKEQLVLNIINYEEEYKIPLIRPVPRRKMNHFSYYSIYGLGNWIVSD